MSVFEKRGVAVSIVTTDVAELDAALYGLSDERVEVIGRNIKSLPTSRTDRAVGPMLVRTIEGYDVLYVVTTTPEGISIVVSGISPVETGELASDALRITELIAMFRGALGV